ncbi:MAG: aspartate kinase, partial [bacterium]
MIVMKFGGTSVEDAAAIRRAARIVAGRRDRDPLVVVSAMAGMTNALVTASADARAGHVETAIGALEMMLARHRSAADDLASGSLRQFMETQLDDARLEAIAALRSLAELPDADSSTAARLTDALLAVGEILSSHLTATGFAAVGLPARCVDIRPMMRTNVDFGRAVVD